MTASGQVRSQLKMRWRGSWFVANECGGATPAPRVNDYKHEMRTLTIIGEAGYRVGSINSFSNALDLINAKITDPADRMTEHDRTELILNAVMSANQGAVSDDALTQGIQPSGRCAPVPAAQRRCGCSSLLRPGTTTSTA